MNKLTKASTMNYFDAQVAILIQEKYGLSEMEAIRAFLASETHAMLLDYELHLWYFSPFVIFDIWESEKITGNPRNSVYIRGDFIA